MLIGLIKMNLKIDFMLKYLSCLDYKMAYSETRIVISLVHVPVFIFLANFIKGNFGIKTQGVKDTFVKEELVKIVEVKDTEV